MRVTLRPYQSEAVESLRTEYRRGKKSPLFVLPTGGGKTVVFSYIAEHSAARGNSIFILVHRQELLTQASASLDSIGVRHGIIAPGYSMTHSPVQVASVQTLIRRMPKLPHRPKLIIIDEAHHAVAGSWRKIVEHYPDAATLGVTATPIRGDGVGLGMDCGGVFDSLVLGPSVRRLIELGFLVKPTVYAPPSQLDMKGVRKKAGDYSKSETAKRVDKPTITGDAVAHYGRICPGTPAIAFCASVEHAEHVAAQFRAAGFRALRIDGMMADTERRAATAALAAGRLDVLTSCDLISEGFDCPNVGAAILLRPTMSTGLYLQQVGRALRPAAGKDRAFILDHVGNTLLHGLPDEEREWGLDGEHKRKGKTGEPLVRMRQCPKCYHAHEWAESCPGCGHVYEEGGRTIEEVAGELTEITEEQAEAMRRAKRKEIASAMTREDLERIAAQRGYKPGWVEHILRSRQQKAQYPRRGQFGAIFNSRAA